MHNIKLLSLEIEIFSHGQYLPIAGPRSTQSAEKFDPGGKKPLLQSLSPDLLSSENANNS